MRIRNNIPGINATRNQGIVQRQVNKSLEKMASGYRINRAGDDAAGLALSEGMRAQISGLNQAMRNADDGIGLANTGEGALTEVHAMLHRLETLATQAANGTYHDLARENINKEKDEILAEINRICENTEFNEIPLFDSGTPPLFQPPEKSQQGDITLQIGVSKAETMDVGFYYLSAEALNLDKINLGTVADANAAIGTIRDAVQAVTEIRADFGASQNHLEHTHNSLSVTDENMTAAESRIRDTDMAEEFTNFTAKNIVLQSAMSMQSQANGVIQTVLGLLQGA